jgi:hypothetical protein
MLCGAILLKENDESLLINTVEQNGKTRRDIQCEDSYISHPIKNLIYIDRLQLERTNESLKKIVKNR